MGSGWFSVFWMPDGEIISRPIAHIPWSSRIESNYPSCNPMKFRGLIDRFSLLSRGTVYLLANILVAVIPFLLLPVLTHWLSPEEFGRAALYFVVVTILLPILGLNLHGVVSVRYFQQSQDYLARYIGILLVIVLISWIFWIALLWSFSTFWFQITGLNIGWLSVAVTVVALQTVVNIGLALQQARERAIEYARIQVCQAVIMGLLTWIFLVYMHLGWESRPLGQLLALGAVVIWLTAKLTMESWIHLSSFEWREQAKDAIKFGVPLIPHALAGVAVATGGQIMIKSEFGEYDVGLYAVSFQFGAAFGLIADAFVKAYGPWLYKKMAEGSSDSMTSIVLASYLIFFIFIVLGLVFWASVVAVFPWIVGAEFQQAASLIAYFAAGGVFLGMYFTVAGFFFFGSKTHLISVITILSGVIGLLLMYWFGKVWGLSGYAAGYAASQLMNFLLAWILARKVYPLPWFDLKNIRSFLADNPTG